MKKNNKNLNKNAKGFILVLTLFTVLILATLLIGFLNVTAIDLNLIKNHLCSSRAYYIAEAGIIDAIDQIQTSGPLADTTWEVTFPTGTSDKYNVTVSDSSTVITCTGLALVSNFSRELEVIVSITGSSSPYIVTIEQWKETIAQ